MHNVFQLYAIVVLIKIISDGLLIKPAFGNKNNSHIKVLFALQPTSVFAMVGHLLTSCPNRS